MSKKTEDLIKIDRYCKVTLYVLEGAQGLPSVDSFTTYLLLLIKMQEIKTIEVKVCKYTISAKLPRLDIDAKRIYNPALIRRELEHCYTNHLDHKYDQKMASRVYAYRTSASSLIETYTNLHCWGPEENALISTKYYTKGIFFPFRFFFARNIRNKMRAIVDNICKDDSLSDTIDKEYQNAGAFLSDISNLLGANPYLFGKFPTTADIYICSILAPVLVFNYPDNRLNNIICNNHPIVAEYVKNFVKNHGTDDTSDIAVNDNDRASPYLILTAGAFTITVMMGYAVFMGIIRTA